MLINRFKGQDGRCAILDRNENLKSEYFKNNWSADMIKYFAVLLGNDLLILRSNGQGPAKKAKELIQSGKDIDTIVSEIVATKFYDREKKNPCNDYKTAFRMSLGQLKYPPVFRLSIYRRRQLFQNGRPPGVCVCVYYWIT